MLIECHKCNARVDAEVVGMVEGPNFDADRTYLLKCPFCKLALVGVSEEDYSGKYIRWTDLTRVHPRPRRLLGSGIPQIARQSLAEAERCVQAGAYLASAAMCGRALEAVCRHFGTKDTYLGSGIKELKEQGIIDQRLFEWSEALRDARNRAAHANDETVTSQDAEDLLVFSYAILDYVFLLVLKFEQFKERKLAPEKPPKAKRS